MIADIGEVIEISQDEIELNGTVPPGRCWWTA